MNIYRILNILNIKYKLLEHPPVCTRKDAKVIKDKLNGTECNNYFVKDQKGNYFLLVFEESKTVNLKTLAQKLRLLPLSFATELDLLGVFRIRDRKVTPFAIVNDFDNQVKLIIDSKLRDKILLFHSDGNTKTLAIRFNSLVKFIECEEHKCIYI